MLHCDQGYRVGVHMGGERQVLRSNTIAVCVIAQNCGGES